jgi:hypothetical protein
MKKLLGTLIVLACATVHAAEWQWSMDTEGEKPGKAFLWIPPECEYVRGIFFGQQVILEQAVFEHPQIRAACARENLAILFLVPGRIGYDDFGPDGKGAEIYTKIVTEFADISGYAELATAPFLGIGHSGGAIAVWRMGYWKPERCFGVIGLRAAPIGPPKHDPKAELNGVPVLVITGQYETWDEALGSEHHWRWCRGDILAMRAKWENHLGSVLVHPGAGHFNWDERIAEYVSMFVEKAAKYRLPKEPAPAGEFPKLIELKQEDGWLTDHTLTTPANFETAAYKDYKGDPSMAFWHLDEELAKANEAFGQSHGKKLQLVTVLDDGKPLKNAWMQSIDLKPMEDGITMKVEAAFVKETPAVFAFPNEPYAIGHAKGPIQYRLIGSWGGGGEQAGPNSFRIKFDRFTFANNRPGLMFMAYHPGDDDYAYTEQPCTINFPKDNRQGKAQIITFAEIADQKQGVEEVELEATSDAGLPVRFAVIEGPVRLEADKLIFTKIPPRAKFPVKVTVAAYQWGRSVEPLVRSAEAVERSFFIERTNR